MRAALGVLSIGLPATVMSPRMRSSPAESISSASAATGHDWRYAIDSGKIARELGWRARHDLTSGLRDTAEWYLGNAQWRAHIVDGTHGGDRLGLRPQSELGAES